VSVPNYHGKPEYDENGMPVEVRPDVPAAPRRRKRTRGANRDASGPIDPDASRRSDMHVSELNSKVRPDLENGSERVPDASRTHLLELGFVDVADVLDNGIPDPPTPDIGLRTDGVGLFYSGQYNVVFGDPESGKTLLLDYVTAEVLNAGGGVLRIDLDHNGPEPTVTRLLDFGADEKRLRDHERFLYIQPDSSAQIREIAAVMTVWEPNLVVIDSLGELVPLCSAGTDKADDFTAVHRRYIKPFTDTGAAVVAIDHLSKGSDSRAYGATGTVAKKRVIGGTSIRVTVDSAFTPGKGGSAFLAIHKDRHGGLRQSSPTGDKEPLAGKFVMLADKTSIHPPAADARNPGETAPAEDIAAVAGLEPPPTSGNDAQKRLHWNAHRARTAYKAWKKENQR